jgi:hypothetical protein
MPALRRSLTSYETYDEPEYDPSRCWHEVNMTTWALLLESVQRLSAAARRHEYTHSWLYMPLIADAFLSRERSMMGFPFQRPPGWEQLVLLVRSGAQHITADELHGALVLDMPWHIPGAAQNLVLASTLGDVVAGGVSALAAAYQRNQDPGSITAMLIRAQGAHMQQ